MFEISKLTIEPDVQLRDYQSNYKQDVYKSWSSYQSVMLQMPTGTGKTRLFASIVKDMHNYGVKYKFPVKVLILAHRIELIDQISENLRIRYGVAHGVIMAKRKDQEWKLPTQVASIQTLLRRLEEWQKKEFDIIIIDEAHHAIAQSYRTICQTFPNAKILGVTATPYRLNGTGFKSMFQHLIISKPINEFIKNKYLCNYEYFSIRSNSKIQKLIDNITEFDINGDYSEKVLSRQFDNYKIRASLLKTYQKYASGKKGIIYTLNINHNAHVCKMFCDAGIKALAIDSNTSVYDRKQMVNAFKYGDVKILCNVNIFSEGFDCPDVEFIQLARPTKSLSMYLQQVGRGFRPHENKKSVMFLDNVGLYNRFGLPSAGRKWQKYFNGELVEDLAVLQKNPEESVCVNFAEIEEGDEDVDLLYSSEELNQNQINSFQHIIDYPIYRIKDENLFYPIIANNASFKELKAQFNEDLESINELGIELILNYKLVSNGEKWGIFDSGNKKLALQIVYDFIENPNLAGLAKIIINELYGVANCFTCEVLIPTVYEDIEFIDNIFDCFIVTQNDKKGVVKCGNIICLQIIYDEIFLKTNLNAVINNTWHVFDKESLLPKTPNQISIMGEYILIECDELYGFSDKNGKIIYPLIFSNVKFIQNKYFLVEQYRTFALLDTQFQYLIGKEEEYYQMDFITDKIIKVRGDCEVDGKKFSGYGLITIDNKIILNCRYQECELCGNAYLVYDDGVWKIIDNNNLVLFTAKKKKVVKNLYNGIGSNKLNDLSENDNETIEPLFKGIKKVKNNEVKLNSLNESNKKKPKHVDELKSLNKLNKKNERNNANQNNGKSKELDDVLIERYNSIENVSQFRYKEFSIKSRKTNKGKIWSVYKGSDEEIGINLTTGEEINYEEKMYLINEINRHLTELEKKSENRDVSSIKRKRPRIIRKRE
jgi:superfamily II DNA or RNA helicase